MTNRVHVGRGRSGFVFRVARDTPECDLAVKVFVGDRAAKVVHSVLSGAPNPYTWNEDAIRCCHLRRQLLTDLARFWFDGELTVSNAVATAWNDDSRAYELHTEFVEGRPAALCHPFSGAREREIRDLAANVMRPLQKRLAESGFDGLVWQAGRGNPVAANNFLRRGEGDDRTWTWIDLESGVPALIPLDPITLLAFYLPKSLKHRGPLFDDVDVPKLRRYVAERETQLERTLGPDRVRALVARIDALQEHQARWKSQRRGHRSITCALKIGRIGEDEAEWYARRVPLWYGRESIRIAKSTPAAALAAMRHGARWLGSLPYGTIFVGVWKAAISQRYRDTIARSYVARRILRWKERGQLDERESSFLHSHLTSEEASSYLTDFGMHLATKPLVKTLSYGAILPLVVAGYVPVLPGILLIAFGGTIARTAYTLYRLGHSTASGRERPWAALLTGLFPMVGNAAYPVQIVYSGTDRDGKLAQFIIYDTLTRFGAHFPIWGGADTATEHFFNRFGNLVARDRESVDAYVETGLEAVPADVPAVENAV